MSRLAILLLIVPLLALVSACAQAEPLQQTLAATLAPTETRYPTPVFTNTPEPTPTFTATWTPSATSAPTPSPTPERFACWDEGGRIEFGEVRTNLLPLPLSYRIYLPPCYDEFEAETYPVLYLIHGQNFNDDQWDRLGIDEAADSLIASGDIPPLLIVMPRDRSWSQPADDKFGQAVVELLIPYVDQIYQTKPHREYRAIGGLSRGAGWALHLGFSIWESFGAIGMHSLPVFWTDLPEIRTWLEAIPYQSLPRIYMDLGDKDRPQISKSAIWFEELLTEYRIPHEWHLYPGYHEEAYWAEHVEEYLRWYTKNW
ncbi:MAG: alpha/beta hydrolase [Anaerolineales bacterium]